MSKKRTIGVPYVPFGATLVVSELSTRSVGVWIGTPVLLIGFWALWTSRPAQ